MRIVHLAAPSLVLALDDELNVIQVWRVRRTYRPDQFVERLWEMRVDPTGTRKIEADRLTIDSLGLMRVLWRVLDDAAGLKPAAIKRRLGALFADNIEDALIAALRVTFGGDSSAPGEAKYLCDQIWRGHPHEAKALRRIGEMSLHSGNSETSSR